MDTAQAVHILVVDDDEEIRELLGEHLQRGGYRVTTLADGVNLLPTLRRGGVGLLILDVMLPGEDGFSLCRKVREQCAVPIIMLTASADEADRVIGLELGADDYLGKPFSPRELLARIRALLRRSQGALGVAQRQLRFGDWTLDLVSHHLSHRDGEQLNLSGAEFALLHLLLSKANQVLSRDDISQALHGRDCTPYDRSVDIQVSRLRQRLGGSEGGGQVIRTLRNKGYLLACDVHASA
ncbi:response regulator [Atopomonas sediminilitoris]|uniref:response regulator n=1 Tax=Atopomonas sediminilitoris TaxID=2919919 RepID=UPI001F4E4121|nr:response regulator transcription factor [Atopomonas sediminilitoris]MCJ8168752.1 response regulator transcription factor [Atopomonas sediminilitoris]